VSSRGAPPGVIARRTARRHREEHRPVSLRGAPPGVIARRTARCHCEERSDAAIPLNLRNNREIPASQWASRWQRGGWVSGDFGAKQTCATTSTRRCDRATSHVLIRVATRLLDECVDRAIAQSGRLDPRLAVAATLGQPIFRLDHDRHQARRIDAPPCEFGCRLSGGDVDDLDVFVASRPKLNFYPDVAIPSGQPMRSGQVSLAQVADPNVR
jgi:hypothetical protein